MPCRRARQRHCRIRRAGGPRPAASAAERAWQLRAGSYRHVQPASTRRQIRSTSSPKRNDSVEATDGAQRLGATQQHRRRYVADPCPGPDERRLGSPCPGVNARPRSGGSADAPAVPSGPDAWGDGAATWSSAKWPNSSRARRASTPASASTNRTNGRGHALDAGIARRHRARDSRGRRTTRPPGTISGRRRCVVHDDHVGRPAREPGEGGFDRGRVLAVAGITDGHVVQPPTSSDGGRAAGAARRRRARRRVSGPWPAGSGVPRPTASSTAAPAELTRNIVSGEPAEHRGASSRTPRRVAVRRGPPASGVTLAIRPRRRRDRRSSSVNSTRPCVADCRRRVAEHPTRADRVDALFAQCAVRARRSARCGRRRHDRRRIEARCDREHQRRLGVAGVRVGAGEPGPPGQHPPTLGRRRRRRPAARRRGCRRGR